jgi:hypothetical protein
MPTLSPFQSLVDSTHRAIIGVLLAIVALVTFSYGTNVLTQASSSTPVTSLALAALSLLVCFGALAWIVSLFMQGLSQA